MAAKEICHRGGIVRGPKRPPGWFPPGPIPPGPGDEEELWPAEGEDLCFLSGHWRIFQRQRGHRYSIDDVTTAWYAARTVEQLQHKVERALDIGCGIGSVLMMVAWKLPQVSMIGIEAQELSFGLAQRSLRYNGIAQRVEVRNGDLRDVSMLPEGARFDLVTGTPPYMPVGDGVMSEKEQCAPCRFELRGGIEDYCLTAARAMAPNGLFIVCQSAVQRQRVKNSAAAAGLSIVRLRDVVPRAGRAPLFTVFAMKHKNAAEALELTAVEEPPLCVRDADGERTEDYLQMRRDMGMPC